MDYQRRPFDTRELIHRITDKRCFICEFLHRTPGYEHVEVFSTEHHVVFLDRYPTMFGKLMVAPKLHVEAVTGDFDEKGYLALQTLIYRTAEAVRQTNSPERVYILSLGSQAANAHVHWHVAPLPSGVPLQQQQYHALMHEHGAVEVKADDQAAYAAAIRRQLVETYDRSDEINS